MSRWVPAGEYIGKRRMQCLLAGWDSETVEDVQLDILNDLREGHLLARGRKVTVLNPDEFLLDRMDLEYSELQPISRFFWGRFIREKGHRGDEGRMWPGGQFFCSRAEYVDVEILDPETKARGPKHRYPWAAFFAVAVDLLEYEGGLHPGFRKADLERMMTDWALETWEQIPAESVIRERCKQAVDRYNATRIARR